MAAWLFVVTYLPWWVPAFLGLLLVCAVFSLFDKDNGK